MTAPDDSPHNPSSYRSGKIAFGLLSLLLLLLVTGHAWVAEDAFISFRVVDNVVNGFGLRWNIDERVEVYTHPLWLLLHVPIRVLTSNLFLGTLALSILCSAAAVFFAVRSASRDRAVTAVLLLVPLTLSKGFLEFATSGLETPLSFLLAALFTWILLTRGQRPEATPWFALTAVASLAGVNRLDTMLLYLPALGYLFITRREHVRWGSVVLGLVPFLAWEAFSLIYYGFPFPNTAYAKLVTGISRSAYAEQGLWYLLDFLRRDPAAFLVAGGAAVGTVVALGRRRRGPLPYLGLGALAYSVYVVSIGGDYMTLRLWSVPFFLSVVLFHAAAPERVSWRKLASITAILVVAKVAAFWTEPPQSVRGQSVQKAWRGIEDERLGYLEGHALFSFRREPPFRFAMPVVEPADPCVVVWWAVGLKPYQWGPQTTVIDAVGLADPLLARLPSLPREHLFIGHMRRGIPKGYMEARLTRNWSYLEDDNLRRYYEKLRVVTAGPLFAPERWTTIVALNRGRYDAWKRRFLSLLDPYDAVEDGKVLYLKDPEDARRRGLLGEP